MGDGNNFLCLVGSWRIEEVGEIVNEGFEILQECRAKQASDTTQKVFEISDEAA